MNKTAFCKFFKERTNTTFVTFVTEVRINYAKRLLLEQEKDMVEICFECGFNNVSNFNRQFKKQTGITPGEYKREFKVKN